MQRSWLQLAAIGSWMTSNSETSDSKTRTGDHNEAEISRIDILGPYAYSARLLLVRMFLQFF